METENTDWRKNNPLLLESVLADLAKYGFKAENGTEGLYANKLLRRLNPPDCKLIFVFPPKYPLQDIQVFIRSEKLFAEYLKKPIKHIYISYASHNLEKTHGQGILQLCIRGAWNNEDYTKVENVYRQVLSWFRDYNLGESFPEDFNLPEGTLFFPRNSEITIYVPEFFFSEGRNYFSKDSYGTFVLKYSESDKRGVLCELARFTDISKSQTEYSDVRQLLRNLFANMNLVDINGIWFYTDIPPSIIAHDRHIYSVPMEKIGFLFKHLKKSNARMSFNNGKDFIICFFFELYGRKECIFLLVGDQKNGEPDNSDKLLKGCKYVLPQKLTDEELYVRAGTTISLNRIKNKKLLCIGLGAIGSQATINLARMGFKQFTLIDKEVLVLGNIMRHAANIEHVGKPKVEAVKALIEKISPFAQCKELIGDVLDDECEINNIDFDIAMSAIADDRIDAYINEQMISKGKTCVYGRTTDTGYGCRIIRVIPQKDPCLKCLAYFSKFGAGNYIQLADEINQSNANEYIQFKGCTSPSFIGVNLDIQLYANLLSRIVFETSGCGEPKFYNQREANHLIYSTRLVSSEPKISQTHALIEQKLSPLRGCPVCGSKNYPYAAIVILKNVLNKIIYLSEKARNVETGGVLIGAKCYIEQDPKPCLIITHATLPGPKAVKKLAFFDRDTEYCTELVQCYFEFSEGKLNYVGEWHSHTTRNVKPSELDHSSLQKIVLDKKYVVDFPVSIIQSAIDKNMRDFGTYTLTGYNSDNFIISESENLSLELEKILLEDLDPITGIENELSFVK